MKKQKHTPKVKLQKCSVIFMQLGLILALFMTYLILESKTTQRLAVFTSSKNVEPDKKIIYTFITETPDEPKAVKPKQKLKKVEVETSVKQSTTDLKIVDNDVLVPPTDLVTQDDPPTITVDDITEVADPNDKDVDTEPIPFVLVEEMPTFPGCNKKGTRLEKKNCFTEKITKHIQRYFNAELASDLGLSPGANRINTQFTLDKQGNIIDIKVRAPHKVLEKEAIRVIKKLPKMLPAKQRTKPVKVNYSLPINFSVE
jgi:protein TonB